MRASVIMKVTAAEFWSLLIRSAVNEVYRATRTQVSEEDIVAGLRYEVKSAKQPQKDHSIEVIEVIKEQRYTIKVTGKRYCVEMRYDIEEINDDKIRVIMVQELLPRQSRLFTPEFGAKRMAVRRLQDMEGAILTEREKNNEQNN